MELLWLALIGIVEAIVYLLRYRSATERSPWISAAMHAAISGMRVVFVLVGASAVLSGTSWVLAIVVYSVPATIVTGILHEYLERRKERSK